jgi:hypothetical protein
MVNQKQKFKTEEYGKLGVVGRVGSNVMSWMGKLLWSWYLHFGRI